jgi:hypothetical protein
MPGWWIRPLILSMALLGVVEWYEWDEHQFALYEQNYHPNGDIPPIPQPYRTTIYSPDRNHHLDCWEWPGFGPEHLGAALSCSLPRSR